MKLGALFSGGKDSVYAAWLAKKQGHKISCLISIFSENQDSYMFHTPSIKKVEKQSLAMEIPLVIGKTNGEKEKELEDLKKAIKKAKEKYSLDGIVTGAIESVYQASRVQKICDDLNLECFNPLWQKDEVEYLKEIVKNDFKVIITSVAAYPLDKSWLGRDINLEFIKEVIELRNKYKIHSTGEGGEFETFVLSGPKDLFKKKLKVIDKKISGKGNAWRAEIEVDVV